MLYCWKMLNIIWAFSELYISNIKNHWSQVTITNIIMIQKFEVLWELPKCNTDMKWANVGMKNDSNRLAGPKVAKSLQFVKTAVEWSTVNRGMPVLLLKPLSLWYFAMATEQTNMGTLRLPHWEQFIKNNKWLIWFKHAFHGYVLVTQLCWLFLSPWTVTHQAPLSMEFSRQEYWSGLPFLSPGDLPAPGIESGSTALQVDPLLSESPAFKSYIWRCLFWFLNTGKVLKDKRRIYV